MKRLYAQTLALSRWLRHPNRRLRKCRKLGKLLGDHHDLSLINAEVAGVEFNEAWKGAIRRRMKKLEARAVKLAAKVFKQPVHRFARPHGLSEC